MSGLSSSQKPLCEDPLQTMLHHFPSICRGFAWANFVVWSLISEVCNSPLPRTGGPSYEWLWSPSLSCAVKYDGYLFLPNAWQLRESMTQSGFTQHRLWDNIYHCIGSSESLDLYWWLLPCPPPPPPLWQRLVSAPLRFLMIRLPLKDPMWRCLVPLCQMMLLVIQSSHCWHSVHSHQAMNFVLRFPKGICLILDLFC